MIPNDSPVKLGYIFGYLYGFVTFAIFFGDIFFSNKMKKKV